MSPEELEAYLAEMDTDIRAADRDLREIALLVDFDPTASSGISAGSGGGMSGGGISGSGWGMSGGSRGGSGKDVTAANNLGSYAALKPRLDRLVEESAECVRRREELERRVVGVMDRWVGTVSLCSLPCFSLLSALFSSYLPLSPPLPSTLYSLRPNPLTFGRLLTVTFLQQHRRTHSHNYSSHTTIRCTTLS